MRELPSSIFTKAPAGHLEAVFKGETILLTRYGRPYVVLSPPPEPKDQEPKTVKKGR